jgi:hypothetical protein
MIGAPLAHVGGIPLEETLGSLGPALLAALGVAWTQLHARLRRAPSLARPPAPDTREGAGRWP